MLVLLAIDVREQRIRLVFCLFLTLDDLLSILRLFLVVLQDFELAPNEVCLLNAIGEGVPRPAGYESADHAGIVALADEDFQSMLILQRHFHVERVCVVNLP